MKYRLADIATVHFIWTLRQNLTKKKESQVQAQSLVLDTLQTYDKLIFHHKARTGSKASIGLHTNTFT